MTPPAEVVNIPRVDTDSVYLSAMQLEWHSSDSDGSSYEYENVRKYPYDSQRNRKENRRRGKRQSVAVKFLIYNKKSGWSNGMKPVVNRFFFFFFPSSFRDGWN